jgi:hypothetical protein
MLARCASFALPAAMLLTCAPALADPAWQGRWQGEADLNGAPMLVVIDLAADEKGRWVGSITLPGRFVKGAPLGAVDADAAGLRVTLPSTLGEGGAVALRPEGAQMSGEWRQGGQRAALRLVRSGAAQVDLAEASTPVAAALQGRWEGGYELGGTPRQVTLTLANREGGPAQATLLIVGKRRNEVPVDLVVQSARWLRLVSSEAGLALEFRWPAADGVLRGQLLQGPLQADVVLRRGAP